MHWLINIPIRRKLILITVLASSVALLLAGIILMTYQTLDYRAQKIRETNIQAATLAASVTAAIEFNDTKAAQEYLDALKADDDITSAALFTATGDPFASYTHAGIDPRTHPMPDRAEALGQHFTNNQ
jgi:hypothetical protein